MIGPFKIPDAGAIIPIISGTPTFQVSEIVKSAGNKTFSSASVSISNVDISSGTVVFIEIFEKTTVSGTYQPVATFKVNSDDGWTGNDNSGTFIVSHISSSVVGINHDFKAYLLNSDGQRAVDSGDAVVELEDTSVTFNGITDFIEYPEVTGLSAINASNPAGGASFAAPALLPANTDIIKLQWDNMRDKETLTSHPHADGVARDANREQWAGTRSYVVFMFRADSAAPGNSYPETSDANGEWIFVAETDTPYAEIACPHNKVVYFWVGAKTTAIGGSAIVDIFDRPLSYSDY